MTLPVIGIVSSANVTTDRSIIGILAVDYYGPIPGKSSYIAASYVKWVETGGARVLPIFLNRTEEYYDRVLNVVNGMLLPGMLTVTRWRLLSSLRSLLESFISNCSLSNPMPDVISDSFFIISIALARSQVVSSQSRRTQATVRAVT